MKEQRAAARAEQAETKGARAEPPAPDAAAKGKRAEEKAERVTGRRNRAAQRSAAPVANPGVSMTPAPEPERPVAGKYQTDRKLGFPPLASNASVGARLERLDERLAMQAEELHQLRFSLDGYVRGLHRLLLLAGEELPFPERLTARRAGVSSQMDEDGITLAVLREIGIGPRRFVELGVGLNGGNTGFLARELGFSGLMVDGDPVSVEVIGQMFDRTRVTAACDWVTAEGVDDLLLGHRAGGEIDVLGIDIDGNDIWVWEACTACDPRLVIIEFNTSWGPDRAVAVPYDPSFDRHQRKPIYFGASLAAVVAMGERKGYRLVATTPGGPNAFLLRNDVGKHIPALTARDGWTQMTHLVWRRVGRDGAAGDPVAELFDYVEAEGLPLLTL